MGVTQSRGIQILDNTVGLVDLATTGTANTSTYLRGDGAWSILPIPNTTDDIVLSFGGFQFSPTANQNFYFGTITTNTSTPGQAGIPIPKTGTVKKVFIRWTITGGVQGSTTETVNFTFNLNGSSTGTAIVTGNVGSGGTTGGLSNTNMNLAVTEGTLFEIRMLMPATYATPPTNMRFYFVVVLSTGSTTDTFTTISSKSTDYTLQSTDNNTIIEFTAAAILTIPLGLPLGFKCDVVKVGTGDVTISAAGTLRNGTANKIKTQYKGATLYHTLTLNTYQAIGTEV